MKKKKKILWSSSRWNKKKKSEKKTFAEEVGAGMGYCPLFQSESRYNGLYRDTGHRGMQQGGHDTARRPYDTAPRHGWPA